MHLKQPCMIWRNKVYKTIHSFSDMAFDALQKRLQDFENERNTRKSNGWLNQSHGWIENCQRSGHCQCFKLRSQNKKRWHFGVFSLLEKSKEKLFSLGRSLSSKESLLKLSNNDKLLAEIETLKVENQALKSDASGHFDKVNQLKSEIQALTIKLQEFESKELKHWLNLTISERN